MCVSMHAVSKLHTISEESRFVGPSRVSSHSSAIHPTPLSFILTHKGCVRLEGGGGGGGRVVVRGGPPLFVFPSHRQSSRRIGMCFRPYELSALCSQSPIQLSQRENQAEIVAWRRLAHSIQALCQCLPFFSLSQVCSQFGQRIETHTNLHAHTCFQLNRQRGETLRAPGQTIG